MNKLSQIQRWEGAVSTPQLLRSSVLVSDLCLREVEAYGLHLLGINYPSFPLTYCKREDTQHSDCRSTPTP